MKKTVGLVLLLLCFSCSLLSTNYFLILQRCIQQNRIESIRDILKNRTLSNTEKKVLLEQAHQNVIIRKTEMEHFTSDKGSTRKFIGKGLGFFSGYDLLVNGSFNASCLEAACSYLLYKWGQKAEYNSTIEGKINAVKKYETALAIEQLIINAPVSDVH